MLNKFILKILFSSLMFFFLVSSCFAVTPNQTSTSQEPVIKIGMTVALTGEVQTVGEGERLGVQVYFDKVNANGGIGGKKLKLIALDDAYDPLKAAENVHRLLNTT